MQKTQLLRPWEWKIFVAVIVSIGVFMLLTSYQEQPLASGIFLCTVAVFLFGLALDMRTTRIRKGMLILGIGVITGMLYKLALKPAMKCALSLVYLDEPCVLDLAEYVNGFITANTIDTLILLITIACGGVGGSILAAHCDVTATDAKNTSAAAPSNIQTLLESIESKLDRQNLKLNLVCAGAFGVLLLVIVRVFS